jgi:Lon protease-like protein
MLPTTIPIFPLPNVVLFPNVFLPLHIFEPRYRAMVGDALGGDRIIGMVLLQPGYEADYNGRPPVFPIGCAGVITHAEPLNDGRFNIVLRGLERFRITGEEGDSERTYRLAQIDSLPETVPEDHRNELRRHRHRLEALIAVAIERAGAEPRFPAAVQDEDLVNALAQYIELDPLERQALLEREGVLARCRALIDLLEMRTLSPRLSWKGKSVH